MERTGAARESPRGTRGGACQPGALINAERVLWEPRHSIEFEKPPHKFHHLLFSLVFFVGGGGLFFPICPDL